MPTNVVGSYPDIARKMTGLGSLDLALSGKTSEGLRLGVPTRCIWEISGPTFVGKSTLSYFLSGRMGDGRIMIADFEGFDPEYLSSAIDQSGFNGTAQVVDSFYKEGKEKGQERPHGDILQELADALLEPDVVSGVVDSIGAIRPIAEANKELEESVMGRRALLVGSFCRRAINSIRLSENGATVFVINHQYANISGRGTLTAGGNALKYLSAVRIHMWVDEYISTSSDKVQIALVTKGHVDKSRYGGAGADFKIALIPGVGISPELTAVIDCVEWKLATRGTHLKMGEQSFGFISKVVEKAKQGDTEFFAPFMEASRNYVEREAEKQAALFDKRIAKDIENGKE